VGRVSNKQQIPAIYSQFFGTAFLGEAPDNYHGDTGQPGATVIIGTKAKEPEPAKFWSVGASVGSCFVEPWVVGIARGTIAPFNYSFLELGVDFGFVSGVKDVGYSSYFPFAHAAFFWPYIINKVGLYAGAGGGYMFATYSFPEGKTSDRSFALDIVAGINLFNMIDISYTFRTNFTNMISKAALGYTYRF